MFLFAGSAAATEVRDAEGSTPPEITADTAQVAQVPLLAWLNGRFTFVLPKGTRGSAVLFAAGDVPTDAEKGCRLMPDAPIGVAQPKFTLKRFEPAATPSEQCSALLKKLWASGGSFYMSVQGKYFQLAIELPTQVTAFTSEAPAPTPPGWANQGQYEAYFFGLDGTLQHEPAAAMGPELKLLAENAAPGTALRIYYVKETRVIAVDFTWKKLGEPPAPKPILDDPAFAAHCQWLRDQAKKSGAQRYVVCANLVQDGWPETTIYPVGFDDPAAANGHLWTNKGIDVYAYLTAGRTAELSMTGSPGLTSTLYVQSAAAGAQQFNAAVGNPQGAPALPPGVSVAHQPFGPRTAGTNPVLTILLKEPKADDLKEVAKYVSEFYIEREYRLAIRAGIAGLYGPWDKKYETRTVSGNDAGTEIATAQDGVPSADFTVGLSVFTDRVGEFDNQAHFSVYCGLALLSTNARGAEAVTALIVGPELSIGKDFSLALVGGARRTDYLKAGYSVHSPVTSDALDKATVFGLTPVFGIMANLSPYVWTVGR